MRASPGDELTFIVGGDQAQGLPAWREPEAVLELATLAVAEREGVRRADIAERIAALARRRPAPLLRHAAPGRLVLGDPPPRPGGAADPLPRARRGGGRDRRTGLLP